MRLLMLMVCVSARIAAAQTPDSSEGSATLKAAPAALPLNGTVTLSGLAYPQPGTPLILSVTSPSGAVSTVNLTPAGSGRYSTSFSKTSDPGAYAVSAQIGAKGTPSHATFTVRSYVVDIDNDVADNKALLDQVRSVVSTLKGAVDNLPESPARDQMASQLATLDAQADQLPAQSARLAQALAHATRLVSENPDAAPVFQPFFDHLAQLDERATAERAAIDREVRESAKNLATCDAIDHATAALKAVPEAIIIARRPYDFAVAFFTSMARSEAPPSATGGAIALGTLVSGLPKAAGKPSESLAEGEIELGSETETAERLVERIPESLRNTPAYKFVVAETKTFLPSVVEGLGDRNGSLHLFNIVTKLAGDVLAYANEQLFAQYCEKFEGPFKATMEAHFYAKPQPDGRIPEWWSYTTTIAGTMVLRYPKGAAGQAVALSGQLEGGATRFTYKEKVFDSDLFGKMAKGGVVHLIDVPPAATDGGGGGMITSLSSPTSFYIPVTGTFANGTITLTLGDARTDFNESYTRAHTVFTVSAPSTLMLPVGGHFSLPYKDAHWIVYSAMDVKANGAPVLPVTTGAHAMTVMKAFDTQHPGAQNLGHYTMQMRLCNPGCAQ